MPSHYFKDQCQKALDFLGDAEKDADTAGVVAAALVLYKIHRKIVDDTVSKWGYNAGSSDDLPKPSKGKLERPLAGGIKYLPGCSRPLVYRTCECPVGS
jgi:hypothetical protein